MRRNRLLFVALPVLMLVIGVSVAFAATKTKTYSSGDLARPILDDSLFVQKIKVKHTGKVKDVDVHVRLDHTSDDDVFLALVSPKGTVANLTTDNGGSGDNFGTGTNNCSGTPTVFDDEALSLITAGIAPFAGSFKPEQPLSVFDGKQTKGTWFLVVGDDVAPETGVLGCVKLRIVRKV
jgi:subtilisin-like proprotein convertase family protein